MNVIELNSVATPVLAASDVGIAMGFLASDVAIETADVIIQTYQPSKIA